MINLFVTGMLRSGTTLLEKALNAHPQIKLYYQPFTNLFLNTKRRFFEDNNLSPDYHVLSHYCQESRYTPTDFTLWLERTLLSQSDVPKMLPKDKQRFFKSLGATDYPFSQWYSFLVRQMLSGEKILCAGSKEVLMEEYLPHLTKNKSIYAVIIIRDPRDVITSLDYGRGKDFTGDHRPTLFNLRNWRKSVAFAFGLAGVSNFRMVKFEDLVSKPLETLNQLSQMTGLSPFNEKWWQNGLHDENGHLWKGNSSFGDIQPFVSKAIGEHARLLPEATRLFIEAVCRREMTAMGYPVLPASVSQCKNHIVDFKDPFVIKRTEFPPDYSTLPENVKFEIERLEAAEKDSFFPKCG